MTWILDADRSESQLNPNGELSELDVDVGYGPNTPGGCCGVSFGITGLGKNQIPYPTAFGPGGNGAAFLTGSPAAIGSHVVPVGSQRNDDVVQQAKIEGDWADGKMLFKFGIHYLQDDKSLANYDDFGNNDWQAFAGYGPASGNGPNHGVALNQSWFTGSFSTSGFINGFSGAGHLPPAILAFNPLTVYNYLNSLGAGAANAGCCSPAYNGKISIALEPASVQDITEAVTALYADFKNEASLFNLPLTIAGGVRLEETHFDTSGLGQTPTKLTVQTADPTAYNVAFTPTQVVHGNNTYRYLLPNLDLNLSLTNTLKLRFDASRTLTRPPLSIAGVSILSPDVSYSGTPRVGQLTGTGGNPNLQPFTSDNVDLGLEWYYSNDSYVSADIFVKEVTNFIVAGTSNVTLNVPIFASDGVTQTAATSTWTVSDYVNGPSLRSAASNSRGSISLATAASASRQTRPLSKQTSRTTGPTSRSPTSRSPVSQTRPTSLASTKSTASRPASLSTGAPDTSTTSASSRTVRCWVRSRRS